MSIRSERRTRASRSDRSRGDLADRERIGAIAIRMIKRLRDGVRDLFERNAEWRRRKKSVDGAFDADFRVDTGGVTPLSSLRIDSPNRDEGIVHIAIDPSEMEAALSSLRFDVSNRTFIDLGSGKGRAVLIASTRPFNRIVGVEFAPALHEIAVRNLERASRAKIRCNRIEFVCSDAVDYELPDEPLVLFLHHPFGVAVMRAVVDRVVDSLEHSPRDIHVLYANPFHADAWHDAGFVDVEIGATYRLLVAPLTFAEKDSSRR